MPVQTTDMDRDRRSIDVSQRVLLYEPDAAPLAQILMSINKKNSTEAEFIWWDDDLGPRWDAINNGAGYLAGDTALVVDNASYFAVKDLVKVPRTGEVMRVDAVNTGTNTLTVTRSWGTTAAAALVDNDPLLIIGNALEEGSNAPAPKLGQPTKRVNYVQIMRTPFDVTGTTQRTKQRTGPELQRHRKKKAVEHKVDIERSFIFGEKSETTVNGKVVRTTGGILSWISTNVYDAGGQLTETEWEQSVMEKAFRYGSGRKLFLGSRRLVSILNGFGTSKLQTVPKSRATYGMSLSRYISAHGELYIKSTDVLEGAEYGYYGLILDMENLTMRPTQGGQTKLNTNIQANDSDTRMDEYFTEAGIEVAGEKTHMVVKNATS